MPGPDQNRRTLACSAEGFDVENIIDRGCDTTQQTLPAAMDQGITLPGQTQSLELGTVEEEPLSVDDVEAAIAQAHAVFP